MLFGGTLYTTPLTSCFVLHSEAEIWEPLTHFCLSRSSFCLIVVGNMYKFPRCVNFVPCLAFCLRVMYFFKFLNISLYPCMVHPMGMREGGGSEEGKRNAKV